MKCSSNFLRFSALILIAGGIGCQTSVNKTPAEVQAKSAALFKDPVRGVLEHRCIHCHHNKLANGALNFQDRDSVFQGPFIVPGKPNQSRVWDVIARPNKHPRVMPGDGWGLTYAHRAAFLKWIETGAAWPEGKAGQLEIKKYYVEIDDYL
jgi:hypothetical protein